MNSAEMLNALEEAGVTEPAKTAITHAALAFDSNGWEDKQERAAAVLVLTRLLLELSLKPDTISTALAVQIVDEAIADTLAEDESWTTVLLGTNVKIGSVVRVKADAYSAIGSASRHNGTVGTLAGVRNGVCIVRYEDGLDYHHEPEFLETKR